LDVFIDGFAYFSLFPYIIYDHLKCVSRLRATLYDLNEGLTRGLPGGRLWKLLIKVSFLPFEPLLRAEIFSFENGQCVL